MKVFYHADLDGECSAAIVIDQDRASERGALGAGDVVPLNYKDDFPFNLISGGERVWLVDFSLQRPGDWARLLDRTTDLVWIDHHKTALERAADVNLPDLKGARRLDAAGCQLTWEYAWGGVPSPYGVDLIGDYDTWTYRYGDDTRRFQAYLTTMADTRPWSNIWPLMFEGEGGNFSYINTLEMGRQVLEKRQIDAAAEVAAWGFRVEFEGHSGLALNRRGINSAHFDSVAVEFELLLPFVFDGRQWTVSIYRGGRGGHIACSEIAKRYGGGGHAGAAGFQCRDLPWLVL